MRALSSPALARVYLPVAARGLGPVYGLRGDVSDARRRVLPVWDGRRVRGGDVPRVEGGSDQVKRRARRCCTLTWHTSCCYLLHALHSVHKSWDVYFRNVDAGLPPGAAFTPLPSVQSLFTPVAASAGPAGAASPADVERGVRERLAITHLIRAFQVRGHEVAPLDPLGLSNRPASHVPEISPGGGCCMLLPCLLRCRFCHRARPSSAAAAYGFSDADLDRSFSLRGIQGLAGFLGPSVFATGTVTLRELLTHLHATYCGPVGWEYMHVASRDKRNWIRERIELTAPPAPPKEKRLATYRNLAVADMVRACLPACLQSARASPPSGTRGLLLSLHCCCCCLLLAATV